MMKLELCRGTPVRRSVRGAKGFFYPDMQSGCLMIRENCEAERQSGWNDFGEWRPVIVPSAVMSEKDRYDASSGKMVVWVKNG